MANDDDGASPRELLLEAARRDNTELLEDVLSVKSDAGFLNSSIDALGNTALHVAAQYGSYEVMDELLDQEGLEVDPINRMEGDTPLHKAVLLAKSDKPLGLAVVKMLLEAGADPRVLNKQKQKPIDINDPRDEEIRKELQNAEYMLIMGNDFVAEDDVDDAGSGSESD